VTCFVGLLRAAGFHPGGVHLEMSPDDITECVASAAQAAASPELPLYRTACDPRLNARQALQVTAAFADSYRLAAAGRGAA
jgi:3-deoxy-7-phosphoheptulonate synthase